MALQTQLLDVPITGGLAQHVDDRVVEPGSFIDLRNVQYTKRGRLVKRQRVRRRVAQRDRHVGHWGKTRSPAEASRAAGGADGASAPLPLQTERWLSTYSEAEAGGRAGHRLSVHGLAFVAREVADEAAQPSRRAYQRAAARVLVSPGIAGGSSCYGKVLDETTGAVIVPEKELIADAVQIVAFEQVAGIATVVYVDNRTFHVKACWIEDDLATVGGTTILSPPFVNAYNIDAVRISDSQLFVGYLDVALAASLINVGKWQYNAGGNYTAVGVGFTTAHRRARLASRSRTPAAPRPASSSALATTAPCERRRSTPRRTSTPGPLRRTYITLSALGCYPHTDDSAHVTWFGTNVANEDQTHASPSRQRASLVPRGAGTGRSS